MGTSYHHGGHNNPVCSSLRHHSVTQMYIMTRSFEILMAFFSLDKNSIH
ncbi:hypothetical protein TorRG33x02_079000 [Trema orientale]|uniref:Uncharacterized protein n=1 Tax=Trema orientale TaxID=63057 RepID=A0A2P5FEU5_TREOI|nr:hypothetical protein TorRG33x02_079000 [Trema orientale]